MSLWKDKRKRWEDFSHKIAFQVKNGRHTKFWWARWVGDLSERSFSLVVRSSILKRMLLLLTCGKR